MKNSLKHYLYDLQYGVEKLIEWFPTIWMDRDWDGDYVYRVLLKKIRLMEKHNEDYDQFVGQALQYVEIHQCRRLLERIVAGEYLFEELKPVEEKYGEFHFDFEDLGNGFHKSIERWVCEEHQIAWDEASKRADEREKQDKALLWKTLQEKLDCWWD